jgi:multiple sugar transport system permease protein
MQRPGINGLFREDLSGMKAAHGARRKPWLPSWMASEHPLPWLLPASALMIVLGIYPLLYAIWLSLNRVPAGRRQAVFDPLFNWAKIFNDPNMITALVNTFVYTFVALVLQLALGLAIALLLDSERRGYAFLRALMTLPLVMPPAVTAMMFLLMLNGSFGVLAHGFYALGILDPSQPPILANGNAPFAITILGETVKILPVAMMGVILADVWQWTPFMVLIMLAGLRSLPKEPFEAAAIDGANAVQMFTRLTLPMMSRVIAIAVLIRGIDIFRMVDYIHVMTARGPGTATLTLPTYATQEAFTKGVFNYASTIALVTLILIIITSTLFMKIFRVRL